ncbi:hypothetical protein LOY38_28795 [Pseudomonas sp. B21-015]|uniref:hypothetical protein n=1 Tax=Pseudomonas sp. B21-015 TaxID=2895473 RepID=UPI0021606BD4|nr:hypothetical protein [Pseudomonas sp. B21-015]UVM50273.1 hypothetical protein LOY38_28795 [Pseudomonas sp. B21-015]
MKNLIAFLVSYIFSTVAAFGGSVGDIPEAIMLPEVVWLQIAKENEMQLKDVHFLSGGTVGFNGVYVSAVIFEDKIKNCSIFTYSNDEVYGAYDGAPCEFEGAAEIDGSRKSAVPDVYYKVNVFSLDLGTGVNDLVAFYFDSGKRKFCESKSLATWRANGKKDIQPDLTDGVCGSVK